MKYKFEKVFIICSSSTIVGLLGSRSLLVLFHFWSRDVHPVQNMIYTKFHENRAIFQGDITIFKMAAVRHLGIVLPPYETTYEVSVAGRSCLSNFMSIWYTVLNFSHIWLEMLIQAPKIGFWGGLWTPKCDYSSSRPPKGTSLRKYASFKLSTVKKIRWGFWCGRVLLGRLHVVVVMRHAAWIYHDISHSKKIWKTCFRHISRETIKLISKYWECSGID